MEIGSHCVHIQFFYTVLVLILFEAERSPMMACIFLISFMFKYSLHKPFPKGDSHIQRTGCSSEILKSTLEISKFCFVGVVILIVIPFLKQPVVYQLS